MNHKKELLTNLWVSPGPDPVKPKATRASIAESAAFAHGTLNPKTLAMRDGIVWSLACLVRV